MESADLIHILISIVGGLLAILIAVLSFVGSRIHARLDEISKTLSTIERDIRQDINNVRQDMNHQDTRITRLEVVIKTLQGLALGRRNIGELEDEL